MSVFEYLDYKKYLSWRLGKGEKSRFARAVGCSASYLSQVLQGKPHITLEQGIRANSYFSHSRAEGQYFMLILQRTRAGSRELEKFFDEQAESIRKEREKIRSRISPSDELDERGKAIYYSSWVYPALHMLACLPEANDIAWLTNRLGLGRHELETKMKTLEDLGLVRRAKQKWELTRQRIHTTAGSPSTTSYHSQCRVRALESIARGRAGGLHYSSFICHSRADAEKIREILKSCVGKVEETYRPSKEEAVFGFNLDYFEI